MTNGFENTKDWLEYWKNSLSLYSSQKGCLTFAELKQYGRTGQKVFEAGQLRLPEDQPALDQLFQGEADDTNVVRTHFFPLAYLQRKNKDQQISPDLPEIIIPLCCPVWISRSGRFYPAAAPFIPSDLLQPGSASSISLATDTEVRQYLADLNLPVISAAEVKDLVQAEASNHSDSGWSEYCRGVLKMLRELCLSEKNRSHLSQRYAGANRCFISRSRNDDNNALHDLYSWLSQQESHNDLLNHFARNEAIIPAATVAVSETISLRSGYPATEVLNSESGYASLSSLTSLQAGQILQDIQTQESQKELLTAAAIASRWTRAALENQQPPLMFVTTASDQKASRLINGLENCFQETADDLCQRWLPDIDSYAGFMAQQDENMIQDRQTEAFYQDIESPLYLDHAELYLLQKADIAFPDEEFGNLENLEKFLIQKMKDARFYLNQAQDKWHNFERMQHKMAHLGSHPESEIARQIKLIREAEREMEDVSLALDLWKKFCADESVWSSTLSFISSVKQKKQRQRQIFMEENFPTKVQQIISGEDDVDRALSTWVRERKQQLEQESRELNDQKSALSFMQDLEADWARFVKEHFGQAESPRDIAAIDRQIDKTLRFRLFHLASHYWEVRWLQACKAQNNSTESPDSPVAVLARWQRRMMITPCVVTTADTLPELLTGRHEDGESVYLTDAVDLLISDESEGATPERNSPLLALARSALILTREGVQVQQAVTADKEQSTENTASAAEQPAESTDSAEAHNTEELLAS